MGSAGRCVQILQLLDQDLMLFFFGEPPTLGLESWVPEVIWRGWIHGPVTRGLKPLILGFGVG